MNGKASLFKETRTYDQAAKRHISYQTAVCSRCGAIENHPIKASRPLPPEPLVKLFQRRGWVMGAARNHDVCPDCIAEAAEAKRREAEKRNRFTPSPDTPPEAPTAKIISMPPKDEHMKPAENVTALAPRQPQREDKRLIILEIENHYLGPDRGYPPGTTDETVAKSLNVPVKWVADLREEFFGPVVNPELAALKKGLDEAMARIDAHERIGREHRAMVMDLKERLAKAVGSQK